MSKYSFSLSIFLATSLALSVGCGRKSGSSPRGGESSDNAKAHFQDDNVPGWVSRGAGAVKDGESRKFYGVGSAGGIRNPSLLRSTADNRARENLAKTFGTFSASLMKDYMAASSSGGEEQAVEQAVKTAVSMSLKGVEIVDHYIAKNGYLYSLARLDFAKVAVILDAEAKGIAKGATTKVSVDDIFDKHSKPKKKTPPPPPMSASEVGTDSKPAPAAAKDSTRTRTGEKPDWVDGADANFPQRKLLCAVGFASGRGAAENTAFANLSRIFIAKVKSASKDFMGAYSSTGAQPLETQSSEILTEVSTAKIFSGVTIAEVWQGKGTMYALACLERAKAASILREQIAELDHTVETYLEASARSSKAGRVSKLAKALGTLIARAALNAEHRIVDPDGVGVPAHYSHADIAAAFDAAVEALKIGVFADGPYDGDFRSALIQGLSKRGYKVTDGSADGMDLVIYAKIRIEDGGKGTGRQASYDFARAVIQIEIKDPATSKILGSISDSRKEGHRNLEEAERRAVRAMGKKLVGKIGAQVEKAMLR